MRTGEPTKRVPLETAKSHERRVREKWYEKYCPPDRPGIDIGCSNDPIFPQFHQWDVEFGDGDATYMAGVPDRSYFTVYTSHVLEHLIDPIIGIRNWFRLVQPGGHLIICLPHRDLYEKSRFLPSRFNRDHKCYWLPSDYEPPCTFSLFHTIRQAIPEGAIQSFRVLDEGWMPLPPEQHSPGEYAIEAIIRKVS
jgi:SAM-dependent methyltransferase